jgi:hypothetical protein
MKSLPDTWVHPQPRIVLTALLAVASVPGQAAAGEIVGAPIDLSAHVREALLPGATLFDDTQTVTSALTIPKQSATNFHLADKGENLSGRSTQITGAFASSLAESDGNGGVGATAWIGGSPSNTNAASNEQQVAEATWKQSFTYNGTIPASISLHLNIPALAVGLIGVPPARTFFSDTETAEAKATLETTLIHPDSSTARGASFAFGLHALEKQAPSFPLGGFANFADVQFIGANSSTLHLFDSFKDNHDKSNPRFTLDSVSTDIKLGTLQPGDTVSYVYTLTAQGTTHGAEQGYMAFLGDPFGLEVASGNLVLSTAPVPEPSTWMLTLVALGCITVVARRRVVPLAASV